MSEPRAPESPVPPAPRPRTDLSPLHPPPTPSRDRGRELPLGSDGVVDEPSDDARPRFDDDLDPTDAP
ncbi:MAG TPA: hypothetical protein VKY74_01810 [Chloroflexia bacterium]|nr:hypothetical protein [Chloroflexia bacterium]